MSLNGISKVCSPIILMMLTCLLSVNAHGEDCSKAKQYYSLGTKLSDYSERHDAFQKAVQLCPSYVEAHVNLADAYEHLAVAAKDDPQKNRELFDLALEHYRKAAELRPRFFIPYVGLAEVYAAEGLYHKAEEAYGKALELNPSFERARSGLASVRKAMMEEEKAEREAGRAGLKKAEQIVARVRTSALADDMVGMGPADYTVVRARIRFPNIIFDGWSAKLNRKQSREQLKEIGQALKKLDGYDFWVEGHANTVGLDLKDGAARLMRLSEDRAEAVKRYLVSKFGIASNRINARGFGCTRLQFPDDTDEHREKNRRVEIVFRSQERN